MARERADVARERTDMNTSTELLIEVSRVFAAKDEQTLAVQARLRTLEEGIAECQGDGGCRAHKFLESSTSAAILINAIPLTEGELRHLLEDEHGSATPHPAGCSAASQIGRLSREVLRLRERIAVLDHDGGQTDEAKRRDGCTGHLVHHEYTPCPVHDGHDR